MVPRVSKYVIIALVACCAVSVAGRALPGVQTRDLLNVPDNEYKAMSSARHLTATGVAVQWDVSECKITITDPEADITWSCPGANSVPACCTATECSQIIDADGFGTCDGTTDNAGCCPPA